MYNKKNAIKIVEILKEYYPDAIKDTYKGVSGYIYYTDNIVNIQDNIQISNAVTTAENVKVDGCELIEDAYLEIMKAVDKGLIRIQKYEDMNDKKIAWIEDIIKKEYEEAGEHPEYRHFLKGKFGFVGR